MNLQQGNKVQLARWRVASGKKRDTEEASVRLNEIVEVKEHRKGWTKKRRKKRERKEPRLNKETD